MGRCESPRRSDTAEPTQHRQHRPDGGRRRQRVPPRVLRGAHVLLHPRRRGRGGGADQVPDDLAGPHPALQELHNAAPRRAHVLVRHEPARAREPGGPHGDAHPLLDLLPLRRPRQGRQRVGPRLDLGGLAHGHQVLLRDRREAEDQPDLPRSPELRPGGRHLVGPADGALGAGEAARARVQRGRVLPGPLLPGLQKYQGSVGPRRLHMAGVLPLGQAAGDSRRDGECLPDRPAEHLPDHLFCYAPDHSDTEHQQLDVPDQYRVPGNGDYRICVDVPSERADL
mmetsp:Transcript_89113/g.252649  ORF Transcript_89113/g.252649 Transcript_89113/m.252649 type:complete len:283 (-) Transcript_89113:484-1332(-)